MAYNNVIDIVRKVVSQAREFYVEGSHSVDRSFKDCADAGYNPLFMPELAQARTDADKESRLWEVWFGTPSIRATGKTRHGKPVVVYGHVPNYFSNPANVAKAIDDGKLVNGAGIMPQDEFYSLLDQEGNGRVFVVDHDTLRKSTSGVIKVDEALAHPQTVPFLGGQENAERYLAAHKKAYGNRIGVWHRDDLGDEARGRVLFVGCCKDGLIGFYLDFFCGRVVGVAPEAHSVAKNLDPKLEARVAGALSEKRAFEHNGTLYVPVRDSRVKVVE